MGARLIFHQKQESRALMRLCVSGASGPPGSFLLFPLRTSQVHRTGPPSQACLQGVPRVTQATYLLTSHLLTGPQTGFYSQGPCNFSLYRWGN